MKNSKFTTRLTLITVFLMFTVGLFAQTAPSMQIRLVDGTLQTILLQDIDSIYYTAHYELGSTGPGGGIVFYDKGSYSDGWRYLEMSNDLPSVTYGTTTSSDINGDLPQVQIGYGNTLLTNLIANGVNPAISSANYSNNGYSDWWLPTYEEFHELSNWLYNVQPDISLATGSTVIDVYEQYWIASSTNSFTSSSNTDSGAIIFINETGNDGYTIQSKLESTVLKAIRKF